MWIKSYTLPDGNDISVGIERFRCAEPLFQPSLVGVESAGLPELVNDSISQCDLDLQEDFYGNIVLSGATTLFDGFTDRLTKEIRSLSPDDNRVTVCAPPERKYSVWIGGSILSSLSCFQELWVTRDEYDEYGPSIVCKKCF